MKATLITGGCYCGAIRFAAEGTPLHQANCHCGNCRRAIGAQAVAWITVKTEAFRIERGNPRRYRTDTRAWRTFCDGCGTSLTYENDDRPGEIDITTGSLDKPGDFAPRQDVFADEKLPWVNLVPGKATGSRREEGDGAPVGRVRDRIELRVRYGETDQMGTFYNARALDWFECGRSELIRNRLGMSYAELEDKGVLLPLIEAHLDFHGRARYDDLLRVDSAVAFSGRARLRFEVNISRSDTGKPVVSGYTVHAFTSRDGRPIRPPGWFVKMLNDAGLQERSAPLVREVGAARQHSPTRYW